MGVKEQAEHAAALVYRELKDQLAELHSELHALSTRVESVEGAVGTAPVAPRKEPRSRSTGA